MGADKLPEIGYIELCNAQLMMWFDAQVSDSSGYRLGGWLKTDQPFDADKLREAMRILAQSHDALRLRLDPKQPRQWIAADGDPPLNVFELESDDPDATFDAHLTQMFSDPMPFGDNPLWRVDLLQFNGLSYVTVSFHHIIVDTVSVQIALAHLLQAYYGVVAGQTDINLPGSSMLPLVESDQAYNISNQFQADLDHWTERYDTTPPRLITAPTTPTDNPFAAITFRDIPVESGFTQAAEAANLLPHRALFGLLAVVLARRFGQVDLSCGLALHRRDRNSMQSVAMLAGLIPLRATFEDWWTLIDCVAAFDENIDEDLRHNRLPLDALYREIGLTGQNARGLFDVTMSFVPGTGGLVLPTGSTSSLVETREASPISFHATNDPKTGSFSYRLAVNPAYKNIVNSEALADILDATITLFSEDEWADFNDIPTLSQTEQETLETLATPNPLADTPLLPERIAAYAKTTPDAPALAEADGAAMSYAALVSAAHRRAHLLAEAGLKPGQVAALLVDLNAQGQACDLIISLLAIWNAGATFLPLNVEDPEDRLKMLGADADARLVITSKDHLEAAQIVGQAIAIDDPAIQARQNAMPDTALSDCAADDIAYIYYTSGTTGRPKAVPIAHQALASFTSAIGESLQTGPHTRTLSAASPLFDAIFMDIAASLAQGGRLIRLTARNIATPGYLASAAKSHGANYLDLTPTVWRAALASGWTPPKDFTAVTGGEAMDAPLAKRITANGARLFNSYGPTEATVVTIAGEIKPDDIAKGQIPIGVPIPGTQALILTPNFTPAAPGTPGELYLAGPQLATGYLARPGQTASAFIAHPDIPDARLYRTGDLAAWGIDGRITYLGRIDAQIKIRGMRVELAEIEAALQNLPAVKDAAATLQDGQIAAFIVPVDASADELTPEQLADLRTELAKTLPAHMIPAAIATIDALPTNAAGKTDRRALPILTASAAAPYEAPEGAFETAIATQIADLLTQETGAAPDQISRHDSFFALGGHSLMAVRLIARLQESTGTQLPLRALFEASTIKDLATVLQNTASTAKLPPLQTTDRTEQIPLSYAQERLWFVERFSAPGTIAEVMGFDLNGALDQTRLRNVFAALYARHEALRLTVDVIKGTPVQVFNAADALPWTHHDLSDLDPDEQEAQLAALRARPVDPASAAFRVDLVQTGPQAHTLVLAMHHMIYDGVSLAVILAETATLWAANGDPAALPAQTHTYADYAVWQRDALKDGPLKDGLDRFAKTLANPPAALTIPADRPRPDHPTHAADHAAVILPAELTRSLRSLAASQNASLFMVLQTALATLLAREARTSDIIIGTVAAGRAQAEIETAVGPFFNMIALRHTIRDDQSFADTLDAARDQALTAFDDQLVPFEAVIERTVTHRDARTAVSPLFQVLFQLHTEAASLIKPLALGSLTANQRPWGKALAMQDLTFDLFETDDGIEGRLTYATELFDAPRIHGLIGRYTSLLQSIVEAPETACADLKSLPGDQQQILTKLATPTPLADAPLLPARIAAYGEATPDAPALAEADGAAMSYGELVSAAHRRAHLLAEAGLKPGQVAALLVDLNAQGQACDLIISLLAIWNAGATFLPLNVEDPEDRLKMLGADADARLVITSKDHLEAAQIVGQAIAIDDPAIQARQNAMPDTALSDCAADDIAYIYYTSGTTGRPKAVPIAHQALASFTSAIGESLQTGPHTRTLSAASPLFDAIFMDIAASLAQGGRLIRLTARNIATPGYLASAAKSHGANYLDLTPTVWRAALASGWTPPEDFTAVTGGEAMDAPLAKRITANGARLFNSYGPTEATVVTIAGEITQDDIAKGQIPIGVPIPGTQALILTPNLTPAAPGTPGEIYLAGPQLATGYLARPGQTASAFIAHPDIPDARLYRTGDLAAWGIDGRITYLGRIDAQIKIRGMRVELAEIEAALQNLPAVKDAAATLQDGQIAAFIVPVDTSADELTPEQLADLRTDLVKTLPAHMIPAAIATIDALPTNAAGKTDRRALPILTASAAAPYEAPEGAFETAIASQIADLLSQETGTAPEQISRHDSFFALGGHSLMAVRLIARLQESTGTQLPLRALFEAATIKDLATVLQNTASTAKLPPLEHADRTEQIPLSYAQERLWFVERFSAPGTIAEVMGFDLNGALDQARLRNVFAALYARHEALRLTVDVINGTPVQVFNAADALPWTHHGLSDLDPDEQEAQVAALRARPVDPASAAFRVDLVQTGPDAHTLVLAMHHMIYDGVSLAVILAETATLWAANGDPAALPAQTHTYADYAVWQRDALKDGPLKDGLDRFAETLANPPAALAIPADRPRPDHPTHAADHAAVILPAELTRNLRSLAARQNASLFMVLQTALATLLAREARTSDIIIGTVAAGRAQAEIETAVGPFFNMIALRHTIRDDQSFADTLDAARDQALTAFDDQLVPFEAVIERTVTHRDARTAVSPLFQVLFQLHTEAASLIKPLALGSLTAGQRPRGKALAMQDLTFDLFETDDGIEGRLTYATELFDAPRIHALIGRYTSLLQSIVEAPETRCADLNTLPGDQQQILTKLATPTPLADAPLLPARIAAYAVATPDAPALAEADGVAMSYGELMTAAHRRAHLLAEAGLRPGEVAALLVDLNAQGQACDLIVSLLAIWNTGATFLPLNVEDPEDRLKILGADADARLVIASQDHLETAQVIGQAIAIDDPATQAREAGMPDTALADCDPDAIAYIYYTSGTTGRPKAVPIAHHALASFTSAIGESLQTGPHTRTLSAASPLFDAIFMDIAASLAQGGRLIRLTARNIATPGYLASAAEAHGANYLDLTPTVWRAALASGWTPSEGFTAVTGGEAMDAPLAKRITANGAKLFNSYGPTEATVVTIAGEITPDDIAKGQIPIGVPIPGTQALILTPNLSPAAPGTPGELYLAGPQLATGYLARPGQTASAFIAHPDIPNARLYRTGDLAAWGADGRITYLGRIDAQIKIRGMRVELAEIEAALQNLPMVKDAAATLQDGQIAAFIVPVDAGADELTPEQAADLRTELAKTLPAHMIPAAIAAIDALPTNAAGKTDRRALPILSATTAAPYEAPEGAFETAIATQITDLLQQETGAAPDQISRHDSFFALGGHSLMAVRLIARLQESTGTQLPLRALFEAATIKDLATVLQNTASTANLPPLQTTDRTEQIPLSYAQERLWFVERFSAPGTIAEVMGFDLNGALDQARLRNVFAALYARHEALRLTVDVINGAPVQVFTAADALPWTHHDLSDLDPDEQEAQLAALRARPVDPASTAFRVDLVQTGPQAHTLVLAMHHMIYDGVSLAVILAETATLWAANGDPAALPAQTHTYADYAVWQRDALRDGPLKDGLDRFAQTLANPPAALAIPADRPRPDHPTHAADHAAVTLPAELTRNLRSLAASQNASLFMVLQTALATLLAREARTSDIIIGTVAAGRAQAEIETAVGPFFNMIALRHHIQDDQSFADTLDAARDQALTAFDDQLVPFEAVIERTVTHRDARTAVSPLFQVLFQLHTEAASLIKPLALGSLTADQRPWGKVLAMQDLTFDLFETNDGIEGRLTYATELFDAPRIHALVGRYTSLLQSIVEAPDTLCADLDSLPEDQQQALTTLATPSPLADAPLLPGRITAFGAATPDAPALAEADGVAISYAELTTAAHRRAHLLAEAGLRSGEVAALLVDLSAQGQACDLIISLLAIWNAGATFLPLNVEDPKERLKMLGEDADVRLVIASQDHLETAQSIASAIAIDDPATQAREDAMPDTALSDCAADDIAYIYYTSGTTGRPKAVPIAHQALASFTSAIGESLQTGPHTRTLSAASLLFDAIFMDIAASLAQGGRLIRLTARNIATPGYLAAAAEAHEANYLDLTPTVWRATLASGWTPPKDFTAVTGGEAMDAPLAKRITANGAKLFNSYGPTEATVVTIAGEITPDDIAKGQIPIGVPIPGTQALILTPNLTPAAPGTPGELYLAGPQLATGYLARPGQTASAFIAHPQNPSARLYRTGDLAAWGADGRITYLGRIDAQIKIRGMRVELAEIEATLQNLPMVKDAAATLQDGQIAAFIVQNGSITGTPDTEELTPEQLADLRTELAKTLPAHMIPAAIAAIDALPTNAAGKTDRRALPILTASAAAPYEAPEGAFETAIATQITDLLQQETGSAPEQISRHDSFFALGGHSLMAVRLIARLQETTGTQLPLRALFEAGTIKDLATVLQNTASTAKLPPLQTTDRTEQIPLSYAQERLWFVDRLDPAASAVYRIDGALRLTGALDIRALTAAFDAIVNRHESLRTRFDETGQGTAIMNIAADAKALGFAVECRTATDGLDDIVAEFLNWPYNLASGPLFRAMLLEVGPEDHILAVGGHHAILDGWSVALLFSEVAAHYQAFTQDQIAQVAPLPVQFGDYAVWQRELFSDDALKIELDWWRDRLAGAPEAIALPTDRPRPELMNYRGRSVRAQIPLDAMQALTEAAQGENATLFMGLEASLAAYLMRLGAGEDVVIGTAVAGRPLPEMDPMVGFFINTLALRNTVTPDQTLQEQMRHARDVTLDAFDHQHVPFDAVIETLRPARTMGHAPVVQVMLILQNVPRASEVLDLGGLEVDYFGDRMAEKGAQFDMAFEFAETPDGLEAILTYATALYDDSSAQRILDGFAAFLTAGAQAPQSKLGDLPVMADDTLEAVTDFQNNGVIESAILVPELIARVDPKARAVTDETGNWLTYGVLHARADQIGAAMQSAGIKPDSVVGVCVSRTPDLPATMLAAWKIGAAFVPINPNDPVERQQYMLDDASAVALIMDDFTAERVADIKRSQINVDAITDLAKPTSATGHLAYVLFTSGSTGRPKGVAVSHTSLAHLHRAVMQTGPMTPEDCLISGFESTFDVFVRDVALTLASGAGLVLAQPRNLLQPGHYTQLVEQHGGTWLQLTPTVWRVAMADGWRPAEHMRAEAGGEAMDAELAALLGEKGATVVNAYGPTEVTAVSVQGTASQNDIDSGGTIPIGMPLPGTRAYVLDAQLNQVPPGVPGELVLAGPQVADGYVGQAAQNADAFIEDPITPNGRAYRTGDLVRWLADGRLEFLGRIDAQVKIRGMRVELSEIEATIANLPQIAAAAVAATKDARGQTRLVAYLTTEKSANKGKSSPEILDLAPLDAGEIRAELANTLPEHMIPQAFARLSHLPLMPSGKLDRKALPEVTADLAQAEYVPLQGPMEELIADEIAKLLGEHTGPDTTPPDRIGRHDGFFALGGHSLLAVQLVNRLEAETGLTVPLRVIFDAGDIAQLAAAIDGLLDGELPGAESEVDDARADIALIDLLPQAPNGSVPALGDAQTILVTGVTGFLGRYLLRDLLNLTKAHIICVVRGKDADAARTRVLSALTEIPGETLPIGYQTRLDVVQGELSQRNLGLSPADRARIAEDVDLIVHNGAEVHAMKPYASLRAPNTMCVLEVLRIMSEGRPKAITFVSTLSTLDSALDELKNGFDPEVLTPADSTGYNLSKWAAERMLITAREKGYRSTILRPGLIIGDAHTGYYDNSDDIGQSYTALFVGTQAVPNAMSSFAMPWINVDRAARMILDLTDTAPDHGIGHIFDYGAMPSDVLAQALDVEVLPAKEWLERAVALLESDPKHPSSWLLPRLRGQAALLEGVPDEMIPVEDAKSMLDRYAPPQLPESIASHDKPTPVDGLIPTIQWLADRKK